MMPTSVVNKVLCENRACPNCIRTRERCDLGLRPCNSCLKSESLTLIQECLHDATILKRACAECRATRKACSKTRPCVRCTKRKLTCTPYNPRRVVETSGSSSDSPFPVIENHSPVAVTLRDGRFKHGYEFLLIEPPDYWDTHGIVSFSEDFILNISPMQLVDQIVSKDLNQLIFYYFTFCDMLTRSHLERMFGALLTSVENSLPDLNAELRQILRMKLDTLLSFKQTRAQRAARIAKDSPADFSARENDLILEVVATFHKEWKDQFPHLAPVQPCISVNKLTPKGEMQTFFNEQFEQIFGPWDYLSELFYERDKRDAQWLESSDEISTDHIVRSSCK
jgi:hypothetical protein